MQQPNVSVLYRYTGQFFAGYQQWHSILQWKIYISAIHFILMWCIYVHENIQEVFKFSRNMKTIKF